MDNSDKRKALFVLVTIVVLTIVTLAACATTAPRTEPTSIATSLPLVAPQEIERLTLEESKAAFDSGAALFLDVRRADTYATSHIPGALSIPLTELEVRIAELDPNQWVITYCT